MIKIDNPRFKRKNGKVKYAHMTADTKTELHEFAAKAGIPRHWYHVSRSGTPHYDLNPKYLEQAKERLKR